MRVYLVCLCIVVLSSIHTVICSQADIINRNEQVPSDRLCYYMVSNPSDQIQSKIIRQINKGSYIILEKCNSPSNLKGIKLQDNFWKLASNLKPDLIFTDQGRSQQVVVQYLDHHQMKKFFLGKPIQLGYNLSLIEVDSANLSAILNDPNITYIEAYPDHLSSESLLLDVNYAFSGINVLQTDPAFLVETETIISIKDAFYDPFDLDIIGKHKAFGLEAPYMNQHATTMATFIVGMGIYDPEQVALANQAQLSSSSFERLAADDNQYFRSNNIFIQNHSYGVPVNNFYSSLAWSYDTLCREIPELLHIFSCGNKRTDDQSGTYISVDRYGDITGSFKMAKNILTVSSVDRNKLPLDQNSYGPAYDGRLKPEVVAYSESGTSNAAATTTSVSSFLQQSYLSRYGTIPPSALVKNILMNSAEDVGVPGIDFKTGYGLINASAAAEIVHNNQIIQGRLNKSPDTNTHMLSVPEGIREMKIMLTWTDPPGIIDAPIALVNDLNLVVLNDDRLEYFPQVLNNHPYLDSLEEIAQSGIDTLNVMEQIVIPGNGSTSLELRVSADQLRGSQDYYITYNFEDKPKFKWLFPLEGQYFPYTQTDDQRIYWHTNIEGFGVLYYSLDGWKTKHGIDTVKLSECYYDWDKPEWIRGPTQLMFMTSSQSFISETFISGKPIKPQVTINCTDKFELSWPSTFEVVDFVLYRWHDNRLDSFTQTEATKITINKSEFQSDYYSIYPDYGQNWPRLRSPLYNLSLQNPECYIRRWYGEMSQDGCCVDLYLELNTLESIENIQVFKNLSDEPFLELDDPYDLILEFSDEVPSRGNNEYNIRVSYGPGNIMDERITHVYYTPEPIVVPFPNPLAANEELTLIANPSALIPTPIMEIYDTSGRKVFEQEIVFSFQSIIWYDRQPGIYFYRIYVQDDIIGSGKIIAL